MSNIIALVHKARHCPDAGTKAEVRDANSLRLIVKLDFEKLIADIASLQIELIELQMKLICLPQAPEKADILEKIGVAERKIDEVRAELMKDMNGGLREI